MDWFIVAGVATAISLVELASSFDPAPIPRKGANGKLVGVRQISTAIIRVLLLDVFVALVLVAILIYGGIGIDKLGWDALDDLTGQPAMFITGGFGPLAIRSRIKDGIQQTGAKTVPVLSERYDTWRSPPVQAVSDAIKIADGARIDRIASLASGNNWTVTRILAAYEMKLSAGAPAAVLPDSAAELARTTAHDAVHLSNFATNPTNDSVQARQKLLRLVDESEYKAVLWNDFTTTDFDEAENGLETLELIVEAALSARRAAASTQRQIASTEHAKLIMILSALYEGA